jgi:hypothetical protein
MATSPSILAMAAPMQEWIPKAKARGAAIRAVDIQFVGPLIAGRITCTGVGPRRRDGWREPKRAMAEIFDRSPKFIDLAVAKDLMYRRTRHFSVGYGMASWMLVKSRIMYVEL